ncbi:hypothetical protein SKM54_01810 [Acinetobacter faecalis]|uniref:hypothetical protein n=1 Tax=Acinetobacter faecalis TaxID=2665161 RepID=UPI002A91F100|nr:hypothetical protein [Acinetobacter faecalis]MDY6467022.1 hypothetical protein [Acinetobacter faecalis]MDY6481184.1 hypothetical protein [Acinetobacter faecalis]
MHISKNKLTQPEIDYNFEKLKEAIIIEYEEAWNRNTVLEDKISKFLTTISIVFIAYIYLIISDITWDILKNAHISLVTLLIFLFTFYLLTATNSIINCLNAFQLNEFKRITNFDYLHETASTKKSVILNWELFCNYDDARIHNNRILKNKTKYVKKALESLKLSTLTLSINIFFLFLAFIGEKI